MLIPELHQVGSSAGWSSKLTPLGCAPTAVYPAAMEVVPGRAARCPQGLLRCGQLRADHADGKIWASCPKPILTT